MALHEDDLAGSRQALVFLMIPGLGYFYSGLARLRHALSLVFMCFLSITVVAIQWFLFGYSLAFAPSSSIWIGGGSFCLLRGIWYDVPVGEASSLVFMILQLMFATITPAIIFGSAAERIRIVPAAVFIFIWSTVVYCTIAYWAWGPSGWAKTMGVLDFAGGTVVHISSGFAALAYALVLGKRHGHKDEFKPHSASNVALGTALLWFGWFGFNGGSALDATDRAVMAIIVTHLSAAVGGGTWALLDRLRKGKWSLVGYCSGAVAGLVGITPGSGFVSPASALAIGASTAVACHFGVELKHKLGFDDALDCFGVHGIGGIYGCIVAGIFAENSIAQLDGATIPGGWLDGNWVQVPIQILGAFAGAAWSFVLSYALLWLMNKVPALELRLKKEKEIIGTDQAEHGEDAYQFVTTLQRPELIVVATSYLAEEAATEPESPVTAPEAPHDHSN
ncbi:ammonium transporter AmtB-like domain-containing protein [Hyaloraphidium curvatum]|nr:ammonium transporter AmtB-like domain-containing protein [Hyaloraphidium curvatum]